MTHFHLNKAKCACVKAIRVKKNHTSYSASLLAKCNTLYMYILMNSSLELIKIFV